MLWPNVSLQIEGDMSEVERALNDMSGQSITRCVCMRRTYLDSLFAAQGKNFQPQLKNGTGMRSALRPFAAPGGQEGTGMSCRRPGAK
jgi:hypothetical protein